MRVSFGIRFASWRCSAHHAPRQWFQWVGVVALVAFATWSRSPRCLRWPWADWREVDDARQQRELLVHSLCSVALARPVAFAATPSNNIGQIIAAVIVRNLGACSDVLDGAYDDLVAYRVGLGTLCIVGLRGRYLMPQD